MDKPLVIRRKEFIDGLSKLANECGLPGFVMEPILKDFHNLCTKLMATELETAKAQYEQSLKEEAEKKEGE